jgi:radical SAM superfamily enzyme YgiQ (UPF0313 family)
MTTGGDVLLIACYELGHQPLAVAWPAAFLARAGFAPAVMDLSVEPFDREKVARARLVAISVPMHTALRIGVRVVDRVRELNPTAHVCAYGLYATLNADYLLSHGVDSVLGGEVEHALVELARRLASAGGTAAPSAGPANGGAPHLVKLDFPAPQRAGLPSLKEYAHIDRGDGRLELAGYVEASRGCKHLCAHCPIPPVYGGRFFVVPREVVLADVRQLVEGGARHITFGDPDFLNGPRHALEVARALHAEFPDVTFDFTAKVSHLLRERAALPELARLGCAFVVTAVESLSDVVLAHLDKGHTRADIVAALGAVRDAGIAPRPTWVAFTPWTTLDDYRDMLRFIADEGLVDHVDPVHYGIRLLVPPGSLLLQSDAMRPHIEALVDDAFHYRWRHPDPRMDRLQADVAALTAKAAEDREDPAATFARVRALADACASRGGAAGVTATPASALPAADRRRAPRLTEPWFC